jgi:hypothetical protein
MQAGRRLSSGRGAENRTHVQEVLAGLVPEWQRGAGSVLFWWCSVGAQPSRRSLHVAAVAF